MFLNFFSIHFWIKHPFHNNSFDFSPFFYSTSITYIFIQTSASSWTQLLLAGLQMRKEDREGMMKKLQWERNVREK